jgi:hypothetical protein
MTEESREADDPRPESSEQRLDRNTIELLNELRIAGTGIQVMFAFLLIVPFNNGWRHVDSFERTDYFVTLLLVATATFLLLAPPVHHRILFHHHEKRFLVRTANRLALAGMVFVALGFIGILVLLSDVVVGGASPVIVGALAAAFVGGLWFALPIVRRDKE